MEYRSFGPSGLKISTIGFGCGHTDILMVDDDDELRLQTVQLAIDSGINYFDTAAKYANGVSEINLGRTLRALAVDPYVSTKIVLDVGDLSDPRSSVLRLFQESLDRLGMERVTGLLLHNRILRDPRPGQRIANDAVLSVEHVLGVNGVARAFSELRSQGRVDSVGFTANHSCDPYAAADLIESGAFDSINADFSIMNPSAHVVAPDDFPLHNYRQVISRAAAARMGVVAMRLLDGGQLVSSEPKADRAQRLIAAAQSMGKDTVNVAIRYAIFTEGVSSAILGFSQPSHVLDAVAAANDGPLPEGSNVLLEDIAVG